MKIYKDQYFKNLTGYKISNSHFELGSNLHINDYYYAKRLFYNSFYTNRFAFIIVNYILKEFSELIIDLVENRKENLPQPENTITLLGYDNYSELLISNVRKMLNDYITSKGNVYTSELFNHEIFTKDSLFLKNPDKIGKSIISIFPISTTLSTTIKVQSELKSLLKKEYNKDNINFLNPIINFILIANNEFEEDKEFASIDKEFEYGWLNYNHNQRKVEVTNLDDSNVISQMFFINLVTSWEKINECKACYPDKKSEEKCLIETKSSPVTPDLIFSYPKTYCYQKKEIYNFFKTKNYGPIVYRKHFKRYNNNFIYYIKAGVFLKQNKKSIIEWLSNIRQELKFDIDQNVVIVTPSIGANSGFVNLVNDCIFSDTATIIQYNPTEDYLYNFKKFYSEIIVTADLVIFVDDILFSTNTFNDINFYIKSITRNVGSGVNRCISLINRAGFYNYNKLIENLEHDEKENKKIFSFIDINVAPLLHRKTYPFEKLKKKFNELSEKSVLDDMRLHFENKEKEFASIDLVSDYKNIEDYGTDRALFQFLIFNELNSLFSYDPDKKEYVNKELLEYCFESKNVLSYKQIEELLYKNSSISKFLVDKPSFNYEVKNLIYKTFSSEPFIQFKNIKLTVFDWVLNDLVKMVEEIAKKGKVEEDFFHAKKHGQPVEYSPFQEYKFLLKRGIKLKMNYVYSRDVLMVNEIVLKGISEFKKITKFILEEKVQNKNINPESLFDDLQLTPQYYLIEDGKESEKITSNDFITYYVGLLQELIIDHEAKALETVKNVKEIIDLKQSLFPETNVNLKNTYNDDFMVLLRRLVLENTFIFHTSSNKFINKQDEKLTFENLKNNTKLDSFIDELEKDFGKYSFNYTKKMLSTFDTSNVKIDFVNDEKMFNSFKFMLMLKSALIDDSGNNKSSALSVKDKIEIILKYCCQLLDIQKGGAFFAVKYKNRESVITHEDDIAIVGEFHNNPNEIIKSNDIDKNSIVYNMFNGIKRLNGEFSLSCFELSMDENNEYQYLNNDKINGENINDFIEVEEEKFKNLFYLKISEIDVISGKNPKIYPKAVICFYDNIKKEKGYDFIRFDPKRVRQLLLLRNDLNDFINHHLDNDGLRAYIEDQNQFVINNTITHSYDTYVKQYKEALIDIEDSKTRNKFDVLGTLILNKHFLLKFIIEYKKNNSIEFTLGQLNIEPKLLSVQDFKDTVEMYADIIFKIPLSKYGIIDSQFVCINYAVDSELKIVWYDYFYKEFVFELFYNIRKLYFPLINSKNIMKIDITIDKQNEILIIKNNLYDLLPLFKTPFAKIVRTMNSEKEKKGLSLINKISLIMYGRKCEINQSQDEIEIVIPMKFL